MLMPNLLFQILFDKKSFSFYSIQIIISIILIRENLIFSFLKINLIIETSNARPGTRSALSRRNGIRELSTDYLLIINTISKSKTKKSFTKQASDSSSSITLQ